MERTNFRLVCKTLLVAASVVWAAGCAMPVPPDAQKMYTQQQLNTLAQQPNPPPLAPAPGTQPSSTDETEPSTR